MTVRIPMVVHAVLSRQDLVDDSVSYEIEVSVLNVQLRVPCPPALIERIDMHIRGDMESVPVAQQQQQQQQQQPSAQRRGEQQSAQQRARQTMNDIDNYEVGVVDGYDD